MADEPQSAPTQSDNGIPRTETGVIVDQKPNQSLSSTPEAPAATASLSEPSATDKSLANEDKKPEPAAGAPEKYEAFKAPEGFEFNAERAEEATKLFKELGLSQEQAQKAVDLFGKELSQTLEEPFKAYTKMRSDWRTEIINSDLGNGTDNLKPEVRADLGRVYAALGDPKLEAAFKEAMDLTGAGDHPAFIRGLKALSKYVTEGKPVEAGGPPSPAGKKPSLAQAIYPNLPASG